MSGHQNMEKPIRTDANAVTNRTVARIFQNIRISMKSSFQRNSSWPSNGMRTAYANHHVRRELPTCSLYSVSSVVAIRPLHSEPDNLDPIAAKTFTALRCHSE